MKKDTIAAIIFSILCLGLLLNTNAQNEWEFIDTGYDFILYDISFPEEQSQIGYTVGANTHGVILKTLDGGDTWEQISEDSIPGLEAVCFTDLNTGYVGGWQHYFAKTTDGGDTWTEIIIYPDIWYFIDIEFWDENNGIAVGSISDVYVTSDAGDSWTYAGGVSTLVQDLSYASADLVFAVGDHQDIIKSLDGGLTWSQVYSGGGYQTYFYGVDFYNDSYGVVGGEYGKVMITSDGGATWSTAQASGFFFWNSVFCIDEDSTVVAGTFEGVYKTTDGGSSWLTDYNSGYSKDFYKVIFTTDNNTGFICGSEGIIMRKKSIVSGPSASVYPEEIIYTQTWVGEYSTFPIEVSNNGNATLTVSNITSDNPVFYTDLISFDVEPEEYQEVNVTFEPDDGAYFTGTLSIESNDPQNPILEVSMQGEGILPQAVISVVSEMVFDTTFVWESSQKTLSIWNIGNLNLEVTNIIISNPVFGVDLTSFIIEPGQSEDVTVVFSPNEEMTYIETLQILSNDLGSPTTVNLEGYGILSTSINRVYQNNRLSAYPNPFIDNVTIVCDSNMQPESQLVIYNLHGQEVKRLVVQKNCKQFSWNGSGKEDEKVPAGIYFGVIEINNSKEQIKMVKW